MMLIFIQVSHFLPIFEFRHFCFARCMDKFVILFAPDNTFGYAPRSLLVYTFTTERACSVLPFSNPHKAFSALERLLHTIGFTPFVVGFVGRVIGVCVVSDLGKLLMVNVGKIC